MRFIAGSRRLAAIVLSSGCTDHDALRARDAPGDHIAAPYGALEPRLVALDALAGRRSPATLRMTRTTIEGVPITVELAVRQGLAVLTVDERADGGTVRVDTLRTLLLVRHVPSEYVGGVEVRKDRLEPSEASAARVVPGT